MITGPFALTVPTIPAAFGGKPRMVNVFGSTPAAGVNPDTPLLCLLMGRGIPANAAYTRKVCNHLAQALNVVAISVNYMGVETQHLHTKYSLEIVGPERILDQLRQLSPSVQESVVSSDGAVRYSKLLAALENVDVSDSVVQVETNSMFSLDDHMDHGPIQALDVYCACIAVSQRFGIDPARILLAGSSLGAYISHLVLKLAPDSVAGILDLTGQPDIGPQYLVTGRHFVGLLDAARQVYISKRNCNVYSDDPALPNCYSPEMAGIRDLFHPCGEAIVGHRRKVVMFAGESDSCVPVERKRSHAEFLRSRGFDVSFHIATSAKLPPGCRHPGHGLGCEWSALLTSPLVFGFLSSRSTGRNETISRRCRRFPVDTGDWIVDYSQHPPLVSFEPTRGVGVGQLSPAMQRWLARPSSIGTIQADITT